MGLLSKLSQKVTLSSRACQQWKQSQGRGGKQLGLAPCSGGVDCMTAACFFWQDPHAKWPNLSSTTHFIHPIHSLAIYSSAHQNRHTSGAPDTNIVLCRYSQSLSKWAAIGRSITTALAADSVTCVRQKHEGAEHK